MRIETKRTAFYLAAIAVLLCGAIGLLFTPVAHGQSQPDALADCKSTIDAVASEYSQMSMRELQAKVNEKKALADLKKVTDELNTARKLLETVTAQLDALKKASN